MIFLVFSKFKIVFVFCFILLYSFQVKALSYYLGISAGEVRSKVENIGFDPEKSYTFSAGFHWGSLLSPLHTEIEYLRLKSQKNDWGRTKNEGVALNTFVDLPLLPIIQPYVGFGFVYMREQIKQDFIGVWSSYDKIDTWYKSDWRFVPQYMLGFDVDLPTVPVAGSIEYRYIDNSFSFEGIPLDSKINMFFLKMRIKF